MTAAEYFGDWINVVDKEELLKIMNWIGRADPNKLCPSPKNIFRAFQVCPYKDCKVVWLGQDPYPQKGVATGVLFGNSANTPDHLLSPSLQIVKEAVIDYTKPHGPIQFDNTLESWAKQGILMINTALTCEVNKIGSHFDIWRPFVSKLVHNISSRDNGLVFLLFGSQAKFFKKDIMGSQHIIDCYHPAYYARKGSRMPSEPFIEMNRCLKEQYGIEVKFYEEDEGY